MSIFYIILVSDPIVDFFKGLHTQILGSGNQREIIIPAAGDKMGSLFHWTACFEPRSIASNYYA
jgi:hypothetical protein